jgi:hypothetical protein
MNNLKTDTGTILGFLEGAQTIIALYESPEGPTNTEFAFKALSDILSSPALLRAQLRLKEGHDTVMLMEPGGSTFVLPLRSN